MTAPRRLVPVSLGDRSYDICIGAGLLDDPSCLRPWLVGREVCLVTNQTLAPVYLPRLRALLPGEARVTEFVMEDGERFKNFETLSALLETLLRARHSRATTLVAVGGGVVGDLTGFAAAIYQRGVAFVQVPTTLLAQVDSSIGGKTAVNHPLGKNMIGAFHQPRSVLIDTDCLQSLPERELSAGLAEVVKYGAMDDGAFFAWLEAHMGALRARDPEALGEAIAQSCQAKARVVAAAGLPVMGPEGMAPEAYLDLMALDKKVIDGRLRLVLLSALGTGVVRDDVPLVALRETLERGPALCQSPT